jgi:hypothetical protein
VLKAILDNVQIAPQDREGKAMTRRSKREIQCPCGVCFEVTLYESVNVRLDPDLKGELLDGRLNLATCPECGRQQRVEIDLFYHDMNRKIAIWVFPEERKDQATEITREMKDMGTDIEALLSRRLLEHGGPPTRLERVVDYSHYLANPHIVFGLDELAELLAQLEEGNQ